MRPHFTPTPQRSKESGYAMAMLGLLIIPMMAFVALATDVGSWYAEATRIQRAADAGALAGVVWMPDFSVATSVATDVAARNGFVDTGLPDSRYTVSVQRVTGFSQQLAVTIIDNDAPVYFAAVFIDDMTIERRAVSEYVLPVPMGSPKNHLGTANQVSGTNQEGFFLAMSGFCSAREDGDLRAARFDQSRQYGVHPGVCPDAGSTAFTPAASSPGRNSLTNGSGTTTHHEENPDYVETDPYEFYVEVNDNTDITDIYLFSPHSSGGVSTGASADRDEKNGGATTITFDIRSPDGTPLDESDNPALAACPDVTYTPSAGAVGTATLLGATYRLYCSIPAGSPVGRYIIAINQPAGDVNAWGANTFSILAKPRGMAADVCDTRSTDVAYNAACPGVFAKDWLSIMAASSGAGTANFFLAEIDEEHEGKVMQIKLFDPGEGASALRILDPTGTPVSFNWDDGVNTATGVTVIDTSGTKPVGEQSPYESSTSTFSNRVITVEVQLPGDFDAAYGTLRWWKVQYSFAGTSVTDRTTWAVNILGDPVRLVE